MKWFLNLIIKMYQILLSIYSMRQSFGITQKESVFGSSNDEEIKYVIMLLEMLLLLVVLFIFKYLIYLFWKFLVLFYSNSLPQLTWISSERVEVVFYPYSIRSLQTKVKLYIDQKQTYLGHCSTFSFGYG
jgi:hypothetical protein